MKLKALIIIPFALFAINLARAGQRIVFHCRGGLGRSGTLASITLLHIGYSAEDAMKTVRKHRPGAIENSTQEGFIFEYAQYIPRRN